MIRRDMTVAYTKRIESFLKRLEASMLIPETLPLEARVAVTEEAVPYAERESLSYRPIRRGEAWGSAWQRGWFHLTGQVPREWHGRSVALYASVGTEIGIFGPSGSPVYGLTSGSVFDSDYAKQLYRIFEPAAGGETVDIWMEAVGLKLFGIDRCPLAKRGQEHRHGSIDSTVKHLDLAVIDEEMWKFWLDLHVLYDLYKALPVNQPRRNRILQGIEDALNTYSESREKLTAARGVLRELMSVPANQADLRVTAVGHAHIDTAWLWPVEASVGKAGRTFASQIANLKRYPEYVFGASQPQLYQFVKDHYPALYSKVKEAVAAGRWELQGGMWIEADCNIPSGESLVRQFVHGKNFYMDEFQREVKNLWIPDVFGYAASLPQIIKKCGCDFFLTQKISWNMFNEFPHNSFRWRGIDGTEVLTHFPPENDYNARLRPSQLINAQERYKENHASEGFVSLFGIGDGGGGPTEEMIERGLRMKDLNGCPRLRFGHAQEEFDALLRVQKDLHAWVGELYLEYHRGTYTTQAKTKKGNRKLELALRETEMLCACLPLDRYPREELDAIWKNLLLNQFHDILPGSSIRKVYEVAEADYARRLKECDALVARAAQAILQDDAECLTLFNSLHVPFTAPIRLPSDWENSTLSLNGTTLPVQHDTEGSHVLVELAPLSFTTLTRGPAQPRTPASAEPNLVLENDLIRYRFAADGTLTEILEKTTNRSVLPVGECANLFSLYEDRPHTYDAWEIDPSYVEQLVEHARPVSVESLGSGPIRSVLRFTTQIGQSTIRQTVSLPAKSAGLRFDTEVEWNEFHRMLKVSFPTRVNAPEASYEIAYGHIRRPTHRNTCWDAARYECCGHRWVDLSEEDHGVGLLNDCKYGYRMEGSTIELTALRSPTDPDPDADIGLQSFTYVLLPHNGNLLASSVMDEALMLNQPPRVFAGKRGTPSLPVRISNQSVRIEALKKAEKEECLVIRLLEHKGKHVETTLCVPAGSQVVETNAIEWVDRAPLDVKDGQVPLSFRPFEFRTFKIRF